jgi:hypothetical protein
MTQILCSDFPVSSGKRTVASPPSLHVIPKSSDERMSEPQWELSGAAHTRRRPARPSYAIAYTAWPAK